MIVARLGSVALLAATLGACWQSPPKRVAVHGVVHAATGEPLADARVKFCANDTSGGDYARPRTCSEKRSRANGEFDLEVDGWVVAGYHGFVEVLTAEGAQVRAHQDIEPPATYGEPMRRVVVDLRIPDAQ